MSHSSEKKRKLMEAGIKVISRKGFDATTLDDICAEADVKKGSFYYYFEDKVAFARSAVLHFSDVELTAFNGAKFRTLTDPFDRVLGWLDFSADFFGNQSRVLGGSLLGSLAQEVSLTHPELRSACNESFLTIVGSFEKDLIEAKAMHSPGIEFDPKKVSTFYLSICQGSLLLCKNFGACEAIANNLAELRCYLRLIFSSSERMVEKLPELEGSPEFLE